MALLVATTSGDVPSVLTLVAEKPGACAAQSDESGTQTWGHRVAGAVRLAAAVAAGGWARTTTSTQRSDPGPVGPPRACRSTAAASGAAATRTLVGSQSGLDLHSESTRPDAKAPQPAAVAAPSSTSTVSSSATNRRRRPGPRVRTPAAGRAGDERAGGRGAPLLWRPIACPPRLRPRHRGSLVGKGG